MLFIYPMIISRTNRGKFGFLVWLLYISLSATIQAQEKLPNPCGTLNAGLHPSDCNRATPGDIINDSVFPGSRFRLTKDSLNGYNWVNFKNGDKLIITNCGCSDFTISFQFTTTRFKADTTDYKYWFPKASELLQAKYCPGYIMERHLILKKEPTRY